ncbi:hypothetical protein MY3296_009192 [Beauveria thailandica]
MKRAAAAARFPTCSRRSSVSPSFPRSKHQAIVCLIYTGAHKFG